MLNLSNDNKTELMLTFYSSYLTSSFAELRAAFACKLNLVLLLQTGIRETLVLPNCESVCIPWMLAEKDDWVPRTVAPFIWVNQEFRNETSSSTYTNNQPSSGVEASGDTISNNDSEHKQQNSMNAESSQEATRKSSDSLPLSLDSSDSVTSESNRGLEETDAPLLENDKSQKTKDLKQLQNDKPLETTEQNMESNSEFQSEQRGALMERRNHSIEQEDGLPKKMGRRERMLDLGKKMSEKLEEKRRHIEEKSRHIVEKMRGP